ncbi:hypothetical protein [Nocardia sp. NPDC057227]|uniref:hypothetical protein n=1 Tax=Nocardia sp. NPDC057227 TaxID=3346056 RepID=UPI003631E6E7
MAVPTAATALVTTGLAVAVNYATGGGAVWVWMAVAVLTVAAFGASLWLQFAAPAAGAVEPVAGVDLRNVKSGGRMGFEKIRAPGVGVRARRVRSKGDMSFEDIEAGRGDASHP